MLVGIVVGICWWGAGMRARGVAACHWAAVHAAAGAHAHCAGLGACRHGAACVLHSHTHWYWFVGRGRGLPITPCHAARGGALVGRHMGRHLTLPEASVLPPHTPWGQCVKGQCVPRPVRCHPTLPHTPRGQCVQGQSVPGWCITTPHSLGPAPDHAPAWSGLRHHPIISHSPGPAPDHAPAL